MKALYIFLIVEYAFIFFEYFYSKHKAGEDGEIYSKKVLRTNVLTGLITEVLFALKSRFVFWFLPFLTTFALLEHSSLFRGEITFLNFFYCVVMIDFAYYVFHRMDHSYKILWVLHRVHHSDTTLNYSTALRVSWFEQIFFSLFLIPIFLVGFNPLVILLAGFYLDKHQFFCHGRYLQLPRFFDFIFITPNNHKLHHDNNKSHQNTNFGGVFSIWDRLFGTYAENSGKITFGVKDYVNDEVFSMQISPIIDYIKKT